MEIEVKKIRMELGFGIYDDYWKVKYCVNGKEEKFEADVSEDELSKCNTKEKLLKLLKADYQTTMSERRFNARVRNAVGLAKGMRGKSFKVK